MEHADRDFIVHVSTVYLIRHTQLFRGRGVDLTNDKMSTRHSA